MLILASASDGRRNLLKKLNIDHVVIPSNIDEDRFFHSNIKELVKLLAFEKAKAVAKKILTLEKNDFQFKSNYKAILACDSLFEFKGKAYGKPHDLKEVVRRWRMMSSKSGIIHTGHCLMHKKDLFNYSEEKTYKGLIEDVISTEISFSNLSDSEIYQYAKTGEPFNCAGGFDIHGKGSMYIESIQGCYTNVVGLSLPWLRKSLAKAGITVP